MNVEDACYRIAIEQRIAELWRYRSWYRQNRWAEWTDLRREHTIELRALVRLARAARRGAAAAARDYDRQVADFHRIGNNGYGYAGDGVEGRTGDPDDYAVPYTESEARYAWGDR